MTASSFTPPARAGATVEKLADSGLLAGLLDITTTEVADLLFGGVLPATADRFGAIARTGMPCVMSVGACDMVNFWAPETMPARYAGRHIHRHNPNVTLMRTTPEENARDRTLDRRTLNRCDGPLCLLLPEKGISVARHRGRSLLGSGGRRRAVRGAGSDGAASARSSRDAAALSHQRRRIRRRSRRPLPRNFP